MIFIRQFFLVIVCTIFVSINVLGENNIVDWSERVTTEQLHTLIRLKVSQIKPLNLIWGKTLPSGQLVEEKIFFGGGRFRRLLNWIDQSLQHHTYQEVLDMLPPDIYNLNPLIGRTDTDIDFFIDSEEAKDWLQQESGFDFKDLDTLGFIFYRSSIAIGGSTIEKVRVNPSKIEDPYGAIAAFRDKQLHFKYIPLAIVEKYSYIKQIVDITKLTFILRAIRHTYDIPRLKITDETWELFRRVITEDYHLIIPDKISKHLNKLFLSLDKDRVALVAILRHLGILNFFEDLTYEKDGKDVSFYSDMPEVSFNESENYLIKMREYFSNITTKQEFITAVGVIVKELNNPFFPEKINAFLTKQMDHFIALEGREPNMLEVLKLFEASPYGSFHVYLVDKIISKYKDADSFINLFGVLLSGKYDHRVGQNNLIKTYIQDYFGSISESFIAKNPSDYQIITFTDKLQTLNSRNLWHKANFKLSKSPSDYIAATKSIASDQSYEYLENIEKLTLANIKHFFELNPTEFDMGQLLATLKLKNNRLVFIRLCVPYVTSYDVLKKLLLADSYGYSIDSFNQIKNLYNRRHKISLKNKNNDVDELNSSNLKRCGNLFST